MSSILPISNAQEASSLLKSQIEAISQELNAVEQKTIAFENTLRNSLANELIEVQELTVLYKAQKKAKKAKRQRQKQKGKNFQADAGLKRVEKPKVKLEDASEVKERKRLYREAMLHVHPDKFSTQSAEDQLEVATEMTSKLIDIYKSGTLDELRSFHAHIFSGNTLSIEKDKISYTFKDDYLEKELARLKRELSMAKTKQTYQVLMEYDVPLEFINELKVYYQDRIQKLKRRTRS